MVGASAELIAYLRPEGDGPKVSEYMRAPVEAPHLLNAALASSLGTRGVVRKTRSLYRIGQTRVHLDAVEGLGEFLELEVVLRETQSVNEGEEIARKLLAMLGVSPRQLVAGAYIDLLESGN